MRDENALDHSKALEIYDKAVRFATSIVIVPNFDDPPDPDATDDIISIRVGGARPRYDARPVPPDSIEMLDSGRIEKFEPGSYRLAALGSQIALCTVDATGKQLTGRLPKNLDGVIARITYRCSEDIGERLALTIHEGMESEPIERIEFGPRTRFRETFDVPLRGGLENARYVFVLWRTGAPTYACPEEDDGWSLYGYFRRDLTENMILYQVAGVSTN
jgi:hypothetical protein